MVFRKYETYCPADGCDSSWVNGLGVHNLQDGAEQSCYSCECSLPVLHDEVPVSGLPQCSMAGVIEIGTGDAKFFRNLLGVS